MDSRQLRYFARIVSLGSFTRAAADLCIAQSALSYQIAHLEDELGVSLLERHSRGVVATDAGRTLLNRAHNVVRELDAIRAEMSNHGQHVLCKASLGAPPSVARMLAPPLAVRFHAEAPEARLAVREAPINVVYMGSFRA
jgi:LysR family nitrogen assimilation transcriptional regulator